MHRRHRLTREWAEGVAWEAGWAVAWVAAEGARAAAVVARVAAEEGEEAGVVEAKPRVAKGNGRGVAQ